jgi:SAM-dependent methyltransferase
MSWQPKYNTLTYNSSLRIQRWVHNKRFEDAIKLLEVEAGDKILDYGCGDGRLLELINEKYKGVTLTGYEPVPEMAAQALQRVNSSIHIDSNPASLKGQFNKIACLETCEHLPEAELQELFSIIKQKAAQSATIVFSVPVETGLPGGIKNVYRKLRGHKKDKMSWMDVLKTIFGVKLDRSSKEIAVGLDYYYSHAGFNHRLFAQVLKSHFQIIKVVFSPFNFLKSLMGNTVFFVCKLPQ